MKASEAVNQLIAADHEMIYGWASKKGDGPMRVAWTTDVGGIDFFFINGRGLILMEVKNDDALFLTKPVMLSRLDSQAPPKCRRWLADNLAALVGDAQSMTIAKDENWRNRWYAKFQLQPLGGATPHLKICVDLVGGSASWSVEYTWRNECLIHEIRARTRYIPLMRLSDA
jgi:hypothetical protein